VTNDLNKDKEGLVRVVEVVEYNYIFQTGDPKIERHLDFKNYMIAHLKEAKEYGELKNKLAIKFTYNVEGYCVGKNEFIKSIYKKAKKWII
jgi:GrpB-like predicted nucleotidyltransferase (UPF0157 family)